MLNIKIGQEFRPALQLKKLYYSYLILTALFFILILYLPVLLFADTLTIFFVTLFFFVPIIVIVILVAYWIEKYYNTILYKFTENEMVWRRGVWFKTTGIVPYNRITNIDIEQGPLSRKFGIASLKIQTAGYSVSTRASAEIKIEGIEEFEGLRELIMGFVRGKKPVAVETYEKEGAKGEASSEVLNELVKIRKLLEKSARK